MEQQANRNTETLGLYLHIPFCRSKCAYCNFYSLPRREGDMERYCNALCRALIQSAPQAAGRAVDTVYIGGGTPSVLGGERIAALMETVRQNYSLSGNCEITVEANPDSVDERLLSTVRAAGVNRLSLGVQCADDRLLALLRRPHTFAQAQQAVAAARQAGFSNLSLDLIFGLPGQDLSRWQQTLEQALALEPEHLSCYGLQLEEGTWLYDHRSELPIPDDDTQAYCYLWTVERLNRAGYPQYEISNFARPGRASRHNLRYWRMQEYMGFGPGAHSDFAGRRFSFARDLDAWMSGAEQGAPPLDEDEVISMQERREEYVMLSLRTVEGFDPAYYQCRWGADPAPLAALLGAYENRGLARQEGGCWHFTPEGFLISNTLLVELLEGLEGQ